MHADFPLDIAAIAKIDSVQKILEVICQTTGLGFSAIARVTDERWIACAVRDGVGLGLGVGGELDLRTTLCNEIRQSGRPIVIDNVGLDDVYCDHATPQKYGFQSYASFPIVRSDGEFFGTLCALDPRPMKLNSPAVIGMFKLFADLVAMHLDANDRVAASEAALLTEREGAKLREQFIAVLGHDLRNPLGAIMSGVALMRMSELNADDAETLDVIEQSGERMAGLISDVLDFARGRLGAGLGITPAARSDLGQVLKQVVAELRVAKGGRTISCEIDIDRPVPCDAPRIAQMLSNLLANALTHGRPDGPVAVIARTTADGFELSVSNLSDPLPPAVVEALFQPFSRGAAKPGQQGLGLGLYIATEIAKAHGGALDFGWADGETRFTFRMPGGEAKSQNSVVSRQ